MLTADLAQTLLGAALGFLAALILSAIVGPLVQARTRRRERWEAAVSEMSALVVVEMEAAIHRFRMAAHIETGLRLELQSRGVDPDTNPTRGASFQQVVTERRAAYAALGELVARLLRLQDVVRLRFGHEERPDLEERVNCLHAATLSLTAPSLSIGGSDVDLDGLRKRIDDAQPRAQAARERLALYLQPIALTMKPPRPVRQLIARWFGRWFGWLRWPYRRARAWAVKRLDPPAKRPPDGAA